MCRVFITSSSAGALFGAALALSGVYLPSVIISQMRLSSFHMLKVFITASASSAVVMALFDRLGLSETKPRTSSSLGLFGRYDGNILGGLMLGLGMSLTGACPGTVLVQLSTGIRSGWYVLAGGILGGVLYARLSGSLHSRHGPATAATNLTVQSQLGMQTHVAVASYVMFCLGMLGAASALDPTQSPVSLPSLLGGALIGTAQAATLVLTRNPVGVSTGYEVVGQYFWRMAGSWTGDEAKTTPSPPPRSLFFAGGIVAGALALSWSDPLVGIDTGADVSPFRGVAGGLVMVLGARLAGGCTSGHGISGMSMLGVSSFITVACMFVGGIGSAFFVQ